MSKGSIIITGAATGIGAVTAALAAADGFPVCVNYRASADAAERVIADIVASGGRAMAYGADVRDESAVAGMFAAARETFGEIGGLVNNAAILEPQSGYSGIDADRFRRILETNTVGAFICAKEALGHMRLSLGGTGGAIVNVSSIAARTGSPNEYVDYAASKGAMDTLTVGLAKEVAADGVRVNAVRPGFIATEMHAKGGEPGRVERLAPRIPMQRGGEPEEVARAILWLLSEEASFTTGAFVDVGGGI